MAAGTKMEEAKKLIQGSGLKILASSDLEEAANLATKLSEIVRLARTVDVHVKFELPLWMIRELSASIERCRSIMLIVIKPKPT